MSSNRNNGFREGIRNIRNKGTGDAREVNNFEITRKMREMHKTSKGITYSRTTDQRFFNGNTLVAIDPKGRFILHIGESDPKKEKIHDKIAKIMYPERKNPVIWAANKKYIIVSRVGEFIGLSYIKGELTPEQETAIKKLRNIYGENVFEMPEDRSDISAIIAKGDDSRG